MQSKILKFAHISRTPRISNNYLLHFDTFASASFSHWGFTKYQIPLPEPSNVSARISSVAKTINGKMARKYEAFPDVCTPLAQTANVTPHATNKHNVKRHSGTPMPSLMSLASFNTSIRNHSSAELMVLFTFEWPTVFDGIQTKFSNHVLSTHSGSHSDHGNDAVNELIR